MTLAQYYYVRDLHFLVRKLRGHSPFPPAGWAGVWCGPLPASVPLNNAWTTAALAHWIHPEGDIQTHTQVLVMSDMDIEKHVHIPPTLCPSLVH